MSLKQVDIIMVYHGFTNRHKTNKKHGTQAYYKRKSSNQKKRETKREKNDKATRKQVINW